MRWNVLKICIVFSLIVFCVRVNAAVINGIGMADYILPESSERYLSYEEIQGMTAQELCYARNEIFARYGRKFLSSELTDYFNTKIWYRGIYAPEEFPNGCLSTVENSNVQLLLAREYEICPGGFVLDQPGYRDSWGSQINSEIKFSGTAEYQAYAQILEDGVFFQSSWGNGAVYQAEYFYLFDMTGDGRDEMLVYMQDERHEYFWKVFSCKDDGNSYLLTENQMSEIGNAGHSLSIVNGNCIRETADRSLVGYDAVWNNYVYLEDNEIQNFLGMYVCQREYSSAGELVGSTETYEYTLNENNISEKEGKEIIETHSGNVIWMMEEQEGVFPITAQTIQQLGNRISQ